MRRHTCSCADASSNDSQSGARASYIYRVEYDVTLESLKGGEAAPRCNVMSTLATVPAKVLFQISKKQICQIVFLFETFPLARSRMRANFTPASSAVRSAVDVGLFTVEPFEFTS